MQPATADIEFPDGEADAGAPPLAPARRMRSFLRSELRRDTPQKELDIGQLVNQLSRLQLPKRWPRRQRPVWSSRTTIIVDVSEAVAPLRKDLADLARLAHTASGGTCCVLVRGERLWWRSVAGCRWKLEPASPVAVRQAMQRADHWLLCGDGGSIPGNDERRTEWRDLLNAHAQRGGRLTRLAIGPAAHAELTSSRDRSVAWEVGRPLLARRAPAGVGREHADNGEADVRALLALVSLANQIDAALLRNLRLLLDLPLQTEWQAWNCPGLLRLDPVAQLDQRHSEFLSLAHESPPQILQRAARLILSRTQAASRWTRVEHCLRLSQLLPEGDPLRRQCAMVVERALVQLSAESPQADGSWSEEAVRGAAWLTLAVSRLPARYRWAVAGLNNAMAWSRQIFPAPVLQDPVNLELRQRGTQLIIAVAPRPEPTRAIAAWPSCAHFEVRSANRQLQVDLPADVGVSVVTDADTSSVDVVADAIRLKLQATQRPAWACEWGRDRYGLYADANILGVIQRLRWIEPGEFMMGSPVSEPQRYESEGPQHRVTISRGFWLADTACTQALWQAVMGKNPGEFKGDDQCPVEQVSWDDVQGFLRRLGELLPACEPALPSEAQWEYACRAGSITPFHFGEQISPEQGNYDGNFPYADGRTGEYRERTVPVKALPANAWGLYQMHGNVWEWCADGLRTYDSEPQIDPVGPDQASGLRVLRGGSWLNYAMGARSAARFNHPGDALHDFGFRLSLRSIQPGAGPAEQG